jgi:competence protein ComEC
MRTSFYILAGGFLVGVFWRSLFTIEYIELLALLVGVLFIFGIVTYSGLYTSFTYVTFGILAILLGVVRTEFAYQTFYDGRILEDGGRVVGTGTIVSELDVRDDHAVLYVRLDTSKNESETRLRMNVPHYPVFSYGERVQFEGVVHVPQSFETETGRTFNYEGFLMKDSVQYEVRQAQVVSLDENEGNVFIKKLLTLKTAWLRAVSYLFPEPSASLVGGVVVGAKQSLGDELLGEFRDTGIIHIVVLSGYNLTLVANSIFRVTTFLPRTFGFGFGVLGIASFALMVGAGATVLRASVMAVLGMLATYLQRPYMVLRALILAAVTMVLWNPFILVFDPGFQLSFLATLGLIFIAPMFTKYFLFVPEVWGMREIVSATFATQLTVLPLLLYQIGSVSLVAPVVNVLVLPLVPPIMFLGFIAGTVGVLSSSVALPFALTAHILVSYIFTVVHFFAIVPFASIEIPALHWSVVVFLYGVLIMGYFKIQKTTRTMSGDSLE